MQSSYQQTSEKTQDTAIDKPTERGMNIPKKSRKSATAFRTISEVASELGVQQHVLRFWETKFSHVKPLKRGGGRRYYRPEDVALLKRIHYLLYTEGYTIKGVQKLLKGQKKQEIIAGTVAAPANESDETAVAKSSVSASEITQAPQGLSSKQRSILSAMLGELKDLRSTLGPDEE